MSSKKKIPVFLMCMMLFFSVFIGAYAQTKQADEHRRKWDTPAWTDTIKNPYIMVPHAADSGKVTYMKICSVCHGDKGKGDGVAAAGLSVKPADHTSANVQMQTDGSLFYELSNGHAPMPAYKAVLNEKQRWQLICYIRTLKPKSVAPKKQ